MSKRIALAILIAILLVPAIQPQTTTESQPRFEAADVHASPSAANPYTWNSGSVLRGGRYDLRKATMLELIETAWNVDPDTIFGGPNWLELDRFDVSAKAPLKTPPETIRLMLQALLRDRFGLVVHSDMRPMPAYALTVGKTKPKLAESNGSSVPGCAYQPQPSSSMFRVYTCHNITMDAFVTTLRQLAYDYLDAPVVNETGLQGTWDFDLKWNPRALAQQPDSSGTTIFDTIDQLGLKLTPKTARAPVLVVDRVNEKPTADPPGIDKLLPAREVEFEVADLKPSRPGEPPASQLSHDRYELRAHCLRCLIVDSFDIPMSPLIFREFRLYDGIPTWADHANFDITAKLSSDTFGPAGVPFSDDLRLMLRNLLIERFKIKFHYEDRPFPAYSLVSAKPKMKKADPSHRSSCRESHTIANDPRDSNPKLNRLITCQNVTMTQFASLLQGLASDYLAVPVEDATGLAGAWDFMLSFSGSDFLANAASADSAMASDPNGAISLQDAISKQLGLKLEKRLRPVPILAIDHIEEKPTDN